MYGWDEGISTLLPPHYYNSDEYTRVVSCRAIISASGVHFNHSQGLAHPIPFLACICGRPCPVARAAIIRSAWAFFPGKDRPEKPTLGASEAASIWLAAEQRRAILLDPKGKTHRPTLVGWIICRQHRFHFHPVQQQSPRVVCLLLLLRRQVCFLLFFCHDLPKQSAHFWCHQRWKPEHPLPKQHLARQSVEITSICF